MSSFGRVIGGAYLDANVTTATFGSDLVVQTGIKGRKLTLETVESWQEIPVEAKDSALTAMGKAAAGEEVQPTIADKTFDLVSGLVKDRFPSRSQPTPQVEATPEAQIDVADQLHKLASLRDAGILTDGEFTSKKQSCWRASDCSKRTQTVDQLPWRSPMNEAGGRPILSYIFSIGGRVLNYP